VLLNNFPALAIGGRRGVPWCIGYQSIGSTHYKFALQARVARRRTTATLFSLFPLCKSVEISTFIMQH